MQLTKDRVREIWDSDRRKDRNRMLIAAGALVLAFLLCLSIRYNGTNNSEIFSPLKYLQSYILGIKLEVAHLLKLPLYDQSAQLISEIGEVIYYGAWGRLRITIMALVAGAGLSIAGAIFQTIYKNPMASPNMLGATAGVQIGNIAMVVIYSGKALELVTLRYQYCYIITAICVGAVLLLGRLSGDRQGNPSVLKMVMAGSVISQGLNVFVMYYMYNLEDDDLLIYQELSMGTNLEYDMFSFCIFLAFMAIALVPMLLLRYQFNSAAMDDLEARSMGRNPSPIRVIGQICGVIMITAAMIHMGGAGMISMVVPYAVRNYVGADTRKVLVYSGIVGGILMMLCKTVSTTFEIFDSEIPVAFMMNIFLVPIFMMILARQGERQME